MLDNFVTRHNYSDVIIVGDFNVPGVKWNTEIVYYAGAESVISRFAIDHSLVQVATKPTRRDALLDLVFVASHLHNVEVVNVAPVEKSDHDGQVFSLPHNAVDKSHDTLVLAVDYEQLSFKLQFVDWSSTFARCVGANEYAEQFTTVLKTAVANRTSFKKVCLRPRLPKHIVKLLRTKPRLWTKVKCTGDYTAYYTARKIAKSAIRIHRRNQEWKLMYANNKKAFFSYVNRRTRTHSHPISIAVDDDIVSDEQAAEIFRNNFAGNYSHNLGIDLTNTAFLKESLLTFNSTEAAVSEALSLCPNTSSSPDGLSYKLLKAIRRSIISPLNIIFQHSFYDGIFPTI